MASYRKQKGEGVEADDGLILDVEVAHLWLVWGDLHAARQAGGMAPNPISYAEVEAYCRLNAETLDPWEVRAIRAVDDAYMAGLAGQGDGDG